MQHKVKLRRVDINVDLDGDLYGAEYWDTISNRSYEPDTVGFIENKCDSNTDFFDIGAANGAMSLIAAAEGARVFAYEPDPRICHVAQRNFSLNSELNTQINLKNVAVSSESGKTRFGTMADNKVISSIVTTGLLPEIPVDIQILSLKSELNQIHTDPKRKLIIKMDIEGAEWKIIQDQISLNALKQHNALLLLAVHPGFYRPFIKRFAPIDLFRYKIWQLQNLMVSLRTFKAISRVASVSRTNQTPIRKAKVFAVLIVAGYYEFILDFSNKTSQ